MHGSHACRTHLVSRYHPPNQDLVANLQLLMGQTLIGHLVPAGMRYARMNGLAKLGMILRSSSRHHHQYVVYQNLSVDFDSVVTTW